MTVRVDGMSDWRFPPALLGGAFLFAWVNGVFFTPVLLGNSGLAAAMGPYWDVSCVGVFAGLACLVLAERRLGQVALRPGAQLAAALLQAAGTMALFLSMQPSGADSSSGIALVAGCVGAGLAGLAGAVLFVAWGDAYARHPARESEPAIAVSMCLSLLAACLLFGLSGWGAELLVALLPMGSYALLRRCGAEPAGENGAFEGADQPGRWPKFAVGAYIALLWLVLTFTKGTASAELDARSFTEAFFWPFLASAVASFACLVAYIRFARRISLLSVSRVALPLMCAALVIVMVLPRDAYPAAFAIASVAAMLFDTFLWIHCTNLVRRGVGNPTRVVGSTRAFVQAGAVAVIPFNALARAAGYEAVAGVLMCALVVTFVVSLTGLVRDETARGGANESDGADKQGALGASDLSGGTGRSGKTAEGEAGKPEVPTWGPAAVLDRLAATHGLSSREREVLELLVRGRDLPYIRDELGISRNTVGTHIRHIYQKLDVHSKQELLSLVEEELR